MNQTVVPPEFVARNYTFPLQSRNANYCQHDVGLVTRECIHFERVQIDTPLHRVTVRLHAPIQATVVSIYIPPSSAQCQTALDDLLDQLEGPMLLLGDAHHIAWESHQSSALGRFITDTTLTKQMVISVVLEQPNGFTDNPEEVAEELATYYGERSATVASPPSKMAA